MANKLVLQSSANVFERQAPDRRRNAEPVASNVKPYRNRHGVWQDKGATESARLGTAQPAPRTKVTRGEALNRPRVRSQKQPNASKKAEKVTLWVKPIVKEELERIAKREGLSLSAAGAAFLEEALRQKLHVQHAVLLQPIIEKAIRKQMRGISTRLAWLLVRVAYDSGQTRSLVTNVLGRQPGVTPEILKTILDNSNKTARGNITRRTPQLTELIEAVEDWIQPEGMEQDGT
jgi:hypothetical protein